MAKVSKFLYYAKKHGKFITRNGKWNGKCKYWLSKSLKPLMTYFDIDADNYRTATGSYWIKPRGTNCRRIIGVITQNVILIKLLTVVQWFLDNNKVLRTS